MSDFHVLIFVSMLLIMGWSRSTSMSNATEIENILEAELSDTNFPETKQLPSDDQRDIDEDYIPPTRNLGPIASVPASVPVVKVSPQAEVIVDQIHDPVQFVQPQAMLPVKAAEEEEEGSLEDYYEESYEDESYEDMGYNYMDQPIMQ